LYITMGKIEDGTAPIVPAYDFRTGEELQVYSNPLPSVLILTAIVVGIATTAVALALIVRIQEAYGTIEEDEMLARDLET
ncbi:MAG: cation:proton antiporter subunit C, partial [Planctomycetota bacterium]|nr:cation:proton antiporter subunit C [Planctomycetota bacterium]